MSPAQDKFCQFLAATLDALSLLLEVTALADIGKVCYYCQDGWDLVGDVFLLFKIFTVVPCIEETILFQHIEEILGYLQVCEKLEATKTFLCVQQVYNHVVNHLTQLPGSLFSWATYMYYNFLG